MLCNYSTSSNENFQFLTYASIANDSKSAIISPLYKGKGNIDECDNYRGISILQPIIKVFERILAAQVVIYFEKNNLFCSAQQDLSAYSNSRF